MSNPAHRWLAEFGDQLFAYARARVADAPTAEDLVQETLLAALKNQATFREASQVSTWLIGILRHKIYDHYRRLQREAAVSYRDEERDTRPPAHTAGHQGCCPKPWGADPARSLEDAEFWEVFDDCRRQLPSHLAECFVMRELDQLETTEICKILNITATNLAVRLHRARIMLRRCLEAHWFRV